MNSTDLLDRFRLDVVDVEQPYLWSDEEIYRNIDDAQKMFCRLTGGLPDATNTAVTQIDYDDGDIWVGTHPSILKIRSARRTSDGSVVTVVNYEDLEGLGIRLDDRVGPVRHLVIGMEEDKARLVPAPNEAGSITLLVDRLPVETITDAGDQPLEIKEQHHLNLLHWVKHLAYNKQDAETYDRNKSERSRQDFELYCAVAKNEKDRAKHKTRFVAYGGI
jgi:hypothetical protein